MDRRLHVRAGRPLSFGEPISRAVSASLDRQQTVRSATPGVTRA